MTGNLLLDLAISAAGVAFLVGVSALLGGWRSADLTEAAARERLAFDEPDFRPTDFLLGTDGKAAAACGEGGDAALVFRLGDGLATRRFRPGAHAVGLEGTQILIALKDPSIWRLAIAAPDREAAEAWAGRLAGRRLGSRDAIS